MMNALLFNIGLILMSSLAVSQFNAVAFQSYARYTATVTLFSGQISSLSGIKYVYNALIFVLAVFALLTAFWVGIKPYEGKIIKLSKMKPT